MSKIIVSVFAVFMMFTALSCTSEKVRPLSELNQAQEIYEEGLKLVKDYQYAQASEYFIHLLSAFPDDPKYSAWGTYELGFVFYMLGDDEKAIAYFDQVLGSAKIRGPRILADLVKKKIQSGNGYKNASY